MTGSWKTIRVFISSTFRDMQAERDHLVRFVFPRLRERLLPRRIHIEDADLRWGVTGEQDALEVCREVINECRPRFLCILGGRYGTIPSGKDISITADEVHFGVLNECREEIYALFYFRSGPVTEQMDKVDPGTIREPKHSDKARKLARLKRDIRKANCHPLIYHPRWDAEEQRLLDLKEFGNRVERDILATIDDEFGLPSTTPPDSAAEQSAATDAFVEERSRQFVLGSRKAELEGILRHIKGDPSGQSLCLTGAFGSGKTALLAHLCKLLRSEAADASGRDSVLLLTHFTGSGHESTDLGRTQKRICSELKSAAASVATIPEDPEGLHNIFVQLLREASAKTRVIMVFDGIERFDHFWRTSEIAWIPEVLPSGVRLIFSTSDAAALASLRQRENPPSFLTLQTLTPSDRRQIIDNFEFRYRKKFEPSQRDALLAKTDVGLPLYLLAALEELRTLGSFAEIEQRIRDLPPTTTELFVWILERLSEDDGFRNKTGRKVGAKLVSGFASLLSASRHGLSQRELQDLLVPGDPQATPPVDSDSDGNLAALLYLLRPYLVRRGELIDFHHDQFRNAATKWALSTPDLKLATHRILGDYFEDTWRRPSAHAIKELPFHLAAGRAEPELLRIVGDVSYLEQCLAALGLGFLMENLQHAMAALEPQSHALEQLRKVLQLLRKEAGSFADSGDYRRDFDVESQLLNAAVFSGIEGVVSRATPSLGNTFPGMLRLQRTMGPLMTGIVQRMAMPGTRDSYSWDVYDYGPMGLETQVWIDLPRSRVLTDTVSAYGSQDAGQFQYTHVPMEWDLETGALIAEHESETDDWNENKKMPTAFARLSSLASMRPPVEPPLSLRLSFNLSDAAELRAIIPLGTSINSEFAVFKVIITKPKQAFGSQDEIMLWVCDPGSGESYAVSRIASDLNIKVIVSTEQGLVAFATDDDAHVYRLSLRRPAVDGDDLPVIEICLPEEPDELAVVREQAIEIRSLNNLEVIRSHPAESLVRCPSSHASTGNTFTRAAFDDDIFCTPDAKWLVSLDTRYGCRTTAIVANSGFVSIHGRVVSVPKGSEALPPHERDSDWAYYTNSGQGQMLTKTGRFILEKRRCSIEVWDARTGKKLGTLGPRPQYGGGGNMYGFAVHPSGRYVVSSEGEAGMLTVWDLEKNREMWKLNGLGPLGKVRFLSFLWGGHLLAVMTEDHFLYVVRFWWQSEIVAAIRAERSARKLECSPYGDRLFLLYDGGLLACYRFAFRIADNVTTLDGNRLKLRFHAEGARQVHVAGTFNNWDAQANPLRAVSGELWETCIELAKGRHEFKFVVDDRQWVLDPHVPFVPREFGPNNYIDV